MINTISMGLTGLVASSKKANVAAVNIANASTVGSMDAASPFQAYSAQTTQDVSVGDTGGVQTIVLNRNPPFVPSYNPDSPFANEQGLVNAPNVNVDEEMITLKQSELSYKANVETIRVGQEMQDALIEAMDHKA